jgi:uncharacterized protein YjbJ (UPF0337 family)
MRRQLMSEKDKAGQARKGLIDSVKGKAKEVVGAVTGNDSLTAEGQLEQTQARERKEASTVDALADAEAHEARAHRTEAQIEGAEQRAAVNARAAVAQSSVEAQGAAQTGAVAQSAQQDVAKEITAAEIGRQREVQHAKSEELEELHDAAEEAREAAAAHQSSVQAASNEELEAARLRREADELTNEADLP